MAKRKYTKRSAKNNNSFMIFFFIVIVLAILSFIVTYFVMKTDTTAENVVAEENETTVVTPQKVTEKITLNGTWASYNDGAMLTIDGQNFTIELPSVESTVVASGKIVVGDKKVTFVYTSEDSECGLKPGIYKFVLQESDEVTFSKIDDDCKSRSARIAASWFKV